MGLTKLSTAFLAAVAMILTLAVCEQGQDGENGADKLDHRTAS